MCRLEMEKQQLQQELDDAKRQTLQQELDNAKRQTLQQELEGAKQQIAELKNQLSVERQLVNQTQGELHRLTQRRHQQIDDGLSRDGHQFQLTDRFPDVQTITQSYKRLVVVNRAELLDEMDFGVAPSRDIMGQITAFNQLIQQSYLSCQSALEWYQVDVCSQLVGDATNVKPHSLIQHPRFRSLVSEVVVVLRAWIGSAQLPGSNPITQHIHYQLDDMMRFWATRTNKAIKVGSHFNANLRDFIRKLLGVCWEMCLSSPSLELRINAPYDSKYDYDCSAKIQPNHQYVRAYPSLICQDQVLSKGDWMTQ